MTTPTAAQQQQLRRAALTALIAAAVAAALTAAHALWPTTTCAPPTQLCTDSARAHTQARHPNARRANAHAHAAVGRPGSRLNSNGLDEHSLVAIMAALQNGACPKLTILSYASAAVPAREPARWMGA